MLHLACRHHIFEIVLAEVFDKCLGPSSGPEILLFGRFKKCWSEIDQEKFDFGISDEDIKKHFTTQEIKEIIRFAENLLKVN